MQTDEVIKQIQKLTGKNPPIRVANNPDGTIKVIEYQAEWREGSTEPIETKTKHGFKITYKDNYTSVKLTKDEAKKVDDYIATVLKGA